MTIGEKLSLIETKKSVKSMGSLARSRLGFKVGEGKEKCSLKQSRVKLDESQH